MSQTARVHSIDVLKEFGATLRKFAEASQVALGDAESDLHRTAVWLDTEQSTFWAGQYRKRSEALVKAKEALRNKKIFKDSSGRTPSAVDEEKAVAVAMKRLAEAEQKIIAVKKHSRRLEKEIENYRGGVQRFATTIQSDLPVAIHKLDKMTAALEAYVSMAASSASQEPLTNPFADLDFSRKEEDSMARPAPASSSETAPAAGAAAPAAEPAAASESPSEPSAPPQT